MSDRPDAEGVDDRADADGAAEKPARREHRELDRRTHQAQRVSSRRDGDRQSVARARPQFGPDIRPRGKAVEQDCGDHGHTAREQAFGLRELTDSQINHEANHDDVAHRADAGALTKGNPEQQDERSDDDGPRADLKADRARKSLVKHVPGVQPQVGPHQESVAESVQREAPKEERET